MKPLPHFETEGADGPGLLLVHGILSSRAQWQLNRAALARRARLVIVELWGHGRSPAPEADAPYTPEGWCRALESLREALGFERWWVCGQSLGACVTLSYSLAHPERVAGQVFTNSMSALSEPGAMPGLSALADRIERGGRPELEALPFHPSRARRLAPEVREALLRDAERVSPRGVAQGMRHTVARAPTPAALRATQVPTLLVNGRRERRFQPLRARAPEIFAGLEVVDLDGGHAVNVDAAAGFDAAVSGFLARHA